MTDEELRPELLRWMEVDQQMRRAAGGPPCRERDLARVRFHEVDRENTGWLWSVAQVRGWPLASQVGDNGAAAAWLLAQHADATAEAHCEFHRMLIRAVERRCAIWRIWTIGSASTPDLLTELDVEFSQVR